MSRGLWIVILFALAACAGDEAFVNGVDPGDGLVVLDAGLDPAEPGPLDSAVAFALTRNARAVRLLWWAGSAEDLESVTPPEMLAEADTVALAAVADDEGVVRWEGEVPRRGSGRGVLYWFEATDDSVAVALPDPRADSPLRLEADPVVVDFPWPDWPAPRVARDCRADPTIVFDGAEDEATLSPGVPFDVIRDPVFVPWRQGEIVLLNQDRLARGLGVEIAGQAYFFPLIVMLFHEVSNQAFAGDQFALTYCPLTDTGLLFDTGMDTAALPKFHDFSPSGLFNSNLMVSILERPLERRTLYSQMLGFAVRGPDSGACPPLRPTILTNLATWRTLHPETLVLVGDENLLDRYDYRSRPNPYRDYWDDPNEVRAPVARMDPRLPAKQRVMGVMDVDDPLAVVLGSQNFVHNDRVGDVPVVVLHAARTGIVLERVHPISGETFELRPSDGSWRGMPLYEDDTDDPSVWSFDGIAIRGPATGRRLAWVPSMSGFWFAWSAVHPETRVEVPSP